MYTVGKNKYVPRLQNHLPSRARNHNSLCALEQDLHAPGMRARLIVEPCHIWWMDCFDLILSMWPDLT